VNVSLDTVSPGQVAIELHRIADEIEELPPERPVSDA
jgi:hypothetical protein